MSEHSLGQAGHNPQEQPMLYVERCATLQGELVGPVQLSNASLAELRVQALAWRRLCLLGR